MSDIVDVMYRLRNMAGQAAEALQQQIKQAQAVLDKLEEFADGAEDAAELVAASDLFPSHSALIPAHSGLIRKPNESPYREEAPSD